MRPVFPLTQDVVLVGGGHTHALVLRKWGMAPVPGARLTLIHPGPTATYSGMLPGHIAGHYSREALDIDVIRLARFAGARVIIDAATGLDPQAQQIRLGGHPPIGYDIVSVDVGVTSDMPDIPGFADHALAAKPLDDLAEGWARFLGTAAQLSQPPQITVIGAGVAGAELALACQHRLQGMSANVTLMDRGTALATLPPGLAAQIRATLARARIAILEETEIAAIHAGSVTLRDGQTLRSDCTIGAAGARPHDWLAQSGLPCEQGYLSVDDQLRSIADAKVYAAGDCAHLTHAPRPKAGVFAVRAAPILTHNIRADLTGRQRRRFAPQRDYLKLISLGDKTAIGEKSGLRFKGPWVWRWKDRIDRRFMKKLSELPPMPRPKAPPGAAKGVAEALSGPAPCGGCGAKLGADVLRHALTALPGAHRSDVEMGRGDDAAVLCLEGARQVISTDHLRGFALDPVLVARVAAIHAMGDVWAMGAAPQAALAQITLPQMSPRLQNRTLAEIMAALSAVFLAENVEIVGGHSTQGAELQIGFSVTGLLDGPAVTTMGARAGDALILTRPIGTGVVLAAEMASLAPGPVVARSWAQMQDPQGDAARILAPFARAMTDVTGFGLAGHLWEICHGATLRARLHLPDIPLIDGVAALAQSGIASSLMPANKAALAGRVHGPDTTLTELLFDPQTAGGFLAAVPAADADALVAQLRRAGHAAARIGGLEEGPAGIETGLR